VRRKRLVVGAVVVAVLAAGFVTVVEIGGNPLSAADSDSDDSSDEASTGDSRDELDTVGIERGDLTSSSEFTGELGFGDTWPLSLTADGIVTGARPLGTVVDFGESLIEIDDRRVFLVEGDVPMFRDLELTSPRVAGGDVAQLQRFLIAQGFDRDGTLEADGVFDSDTRRAVIDWQEATWQQNTGRVTRSDMVFNPEPLRIAGEQRIGSVFEQLEVTAWEPTVTVDVANRDRQLLTVGTPVTVEFGDGTSVEGTVSEQISVPQDDGSTQARSTIEPHGDVPGEPGQVTISVDATLASDVLIVPVGALLALAEGGYAVEVLDGAGGTQLVGVDVGEILDGKAEVNGAIDVGDSVLVAR
jgi:peptidoglycan hydrolase-like protein with peptidoglycan-binding domain